MAASKRALVVLTHGFLGTRVQFLPIAASLAQRFDILNFGYKSRAQGLSIHADTLIDAVKARLERREKTVHFVTHSFGGVVLHRAFSQGLREVLGNGIAQTRCVLVAPPMRGACLARAFRKENIRGPEMFGHAVHRAAQMILGSNSGLELMMNDASWYDKAAGRIPPEVGILVIAGRMGKFNPLIEGESDGVVGVEETVLRREHYRLEVGLTHNLLLYSPTIIRSITDHLEGLTVGTFTNGGEELKVIR